MTEKERARLVERSTDLGIFLLGDKNFARAGALAAVHLLPHENEQQKRRSRHKAKDPRRRLILGQSQLVQLTTYVLADEEDNPPYRDRCIEYLKRAVHECLLGSSFDACILVNRFIYDLPVEGVLKFYDCLTHGQDPKEKRVALFKEKQLFEIFKKRFQDLLREPGPDDEYQFVADPLIDLSIIKRYLTTLAPWDACCRLPVGFDESQRVEDLHGRGPIQLIRSVKEESALEVNRVYALLEPTIHEIICKALNLPNKLRIPKFQTTPGKG